MEPELAHKIVHEAIGYLEANDIPEYQWLFVLVGFLRGHFIGQRANDIRQAQTLEPAALLFAEELQNSALLPSGAFIDWEDGEAVALEFSKAWKARKQVQGSSFLEIAAAQSANHDWLGLGQKQNGWVSRIVNAGFCLQELKPETPFLIPVSDYTARLFGTSLRTLALAVSEAIALKFFRVAGEHQQLGDRRLARRLSFNYAHKEIKPALISAKEALVRDLTEKKPSQEDSESGQTDV